MISESFDHFLCQFIQRAMRVPYCISDLSPRPELGQKSLEAGGWFSLLKLRLVIIFSLKAEDFLFFFKQDAYHSQWIETVHARLRQLGFIIETSFLLSKEDPITCPALFYTAGLQTLL